VAAFSINTWFELCAKTSFFNAVRIPSRGGGIGNVGAVRALQTPG